MPKRPAMSGEGKDEDEKVEEVGEGEVEDGLKTPERGSDQELFGSPKSVAAKSKPGTHKSAAKSKAGTPKKSAMKAMKAPKKTTTPKKTGTPKKKPAAVIKTAVKAKAKPKAKTEAKKKKDEEQEEKKPEEKTEQPKDEKKKKTKATVKEQAAKWASGLDEPSPKDKKTDKTDGQGGKEGEGEEEQRDRQKAQKFAKLERQNALPAEVQEAMAQAEKAINPRQAKTALINALFKKENGRFVMIPNNPAFKRAQQFVDKKFGKEAQKSDLAENFFWGIPFFKRGSWQTKIFWNQLCLIQKVFYTCFINNILGTC